MLDSRRPVEFLIMRPRNVIKQSGGYRMIVGVPKETFPGERRVALVPVVVPNLIKAGFQVLVEAGAGSSAGYP